tara:strand:+ start:91 stop:774 length:684 start_codon:yes stop_codon:yes gene_type:complete
MAQALNQKTIWEHSTDSILHPAINSGDFYNSLTIDAEEEVGFTSKRFPSILEFIYNENKVIDSLFSSLSFHVDVITPMGVSVPYPGFSSYIVYTSKQLSEETQIIYLTNTRQIGNDWKINSFRDMTRLVVMDISNVDKFGHPYITGAINVVGQISTSTTINSPEQVQFNVDGMHEDLNMDAIDLTKKWNLQKKFIDKWLGIRLICDNTQRNSVNLYSAKVGSRKFNR